MPSLKLTPENNIDRYLGSVPIKAYPKQILENIKLISFSGLGNELAKPFGSFSYRFQKYPGDVDLIQEFKNSSVDQVINVFTSILKNMVKNIENKKNTYFSEFKAGLNHFYNPNKIGNMSNGKYSPDIKYIKNLLSNSEKHNGPISSDDIKKIIDLLDENNMVGNYYPAIVHDSIFKIIREAYILRWSSDEILKGEKIIYNPTKTKLSLKKALLDKTIIKIDMITYLGNKFVEITNFVTLAYEKNGKLHGINIIDLDIDKNIENLKDEIEKLLFSPIYFSPFKASKRMYSYCRYKYINSKDSKYHQILTKIIPLLQSNISLMYQLNSELDAISIVLSKHKISNFTLFDNSLETQKVELSRIIQIGDNTLENLISLYDHAIKSPNKKDKIHKISIIMTELKNVINCFTIGYFDDNNLLPLPYFILPVKHSYDTSRLGAGSFSSKLFQKAANYYRKNFCQGKSRPLKDGEYHLGCHNFTGPGTRIDLPEVLNYKPYNNIDACSKQHDIDYTNANGDPNLIREADKKAIICYDKYKNESGYTAARNGINNKMKIENIMPQLVRSVAPGYSGKGIATRQELIDYWIEEQKKPYFRPQSSEEKYLKKYNIIKKKKEKSRKLKKQQKLKEKQFLSNFEKLSADVSNISAKIGGQILSEQEIIDKWRLHQKTPYSKPLSSEEKYIKKFSSIQSNKKKQLLAKLQKFKKDQKIQSTLEDLSSNLADLSKKFDLSDYFTKDELDEMKALHVKHAKEADLSTLSKKNNNIPSSFNEADLDLLNL